MNIRNIYLKLMAEAIIAKKKGITADALDTAQRALRFPWRITPNDFNELHRIYTRQIDLRGPSIRGSFDEGRAPGSSNRPGS